MTSPRIIEESISTRIRRVRSVDDLMRTLFAARKADDVAFPQHPFTLGRTERRLASKHDHPFLVQVMRVVGPKLVARLDLGHGRADQLPADALPDKHGLDAPALAVSRPIPLVTVEVEGFHSRNASNLRRREVYVVLGRSVSSGDIPEHWPRGTSCSPAAVVEHRAPRRRLFDKPGLALSLVEKPSSAS